MEEEIMLNLKCGLLIHTELTPTDLAFPTIMGVDASGTYTLLQATLPIPVMGEFKDLLDISRFDTIYNNLVEYIEANVTEYSSWEMYIDLAGRCWTLKPAVDEPYDISYVRHPDQRHWAITGSKV